MWWVKNRRDVFATLDRVAQRGTNAGRISADEWSIAMAQTAITVEQFWSVFQMMPRTSRVQFLERLVADETTRQEIEDLLDLAVVRDRSDEPVRPLDEVLAKIDK
jgi:hypothetical protein